MRNLPFIERSVRRSAIYRGRVSRMISGSDLKRRCVFMHLPKCGGTSLSEALYALVPLNKKIGILDSPSIRVALGILAGGDGDFRQFHDEGDNAEAIARFREQLLVMHMAHDCQLIHGHFLFSERAEEHFGDRYSYITIMRDPVERTWSNFRMAKRNKVFDGSLEEFVETPMGARMALQGLRYFTGQATVAPDTYSDAVETAKAVMDRFAVIGFIDQQKKFVSDFHDVFGARPRIGHHNQGGDGDSGPSADVRKLLEPLCAPDIELFEYARSTRA